jgi:DNA topoisomerase-1
VYARVNHSFGLTTLRDQHVDITGATLRFQFHGKTGKEHLIEVHDRRLARIMRQCHDLPGQELFQYVDDEGQRRTIDSREGAGAIVARCLYAGATCYLPNCD